MKILRKIIQSQVFRITSLNSLSVLVRALTGLISTSVIAKVLGPSGVALLGNLRNFMTSLETIAILGFNNGIVKYIAQNQQDKSELKKIISTVFWVLLGSSIILGLVLFGFSGFWSRHIFGSDADYKIVFNVLAFSLPFYAMSVFLVAVVNGLSEYQKVIRINIWTNLLGFAFSMMLILSYEIKGALISMVSIPFITFTVSWFWISQSFDLKAYISHRICNLDILKNLSAYSLMAFISAFLLPLAYLNIRNQAIIELGIEQAGNWEAINRLSNFYMIFVSTLLTIYFYPKLSKATSDKQTSKVLSEYYKSVLPMYVLGALFLYICKDLLISLIYSEKFTTLPNLFLWQLGGDFFKTASLILGYQFFARKMTRTFLISELFSITILYLSSSYLMQVFGAEGLVMAHLVTYIVYFALLLFIFRNLILKSFSSKASQSTDIP